MTESTTARLRQFIGRSLIDNREDGDGMSSAAIAEWLGRGEAAEIEVQLEAMVADGELELTGKVARYHGSGSGNVFRLTQKGLDIHLPERFRPKMRLCMCCRKDFMSSHAGNRICEACTNSMDGGHNPSIVVESGFNKDGAHHVAPHLGYEFDSLAEAA